MILGYNTPPIDVTPVFSYLTKEDDQTALGLITNVLGAAASTVTQMFGKFSGAVESAVGTKYSAKVVTKKKAEHDTLWDKNNASKPNSNSTDLVRPFTVED